MGWKMWTALAVILFGAVIWLGVGGINYLFMISTGGTIRMIGQADFVSNDPDLGGKVWLLGLSLDGRGQYFVGTISAGGLVDGDYKNQYDVKIESFVDKEQCEYQINPTGNYLYHLQYEKFTRTVFPYDNVVEFGQFELNCKQRDNWIFTTKYLSSDYYCIWTTNSRLAGTMGTPFTAFEARVRATSNNEYHEGHISNLGAGQDKVSDKLYVYWTGNTVSGDQCPIASSEDAMGLYSGGQWIVAYTVDYNKWKTEYNALATCVGGGSVENCVSNINYWESSASVPYYEFNAGFTPQSTGGMTNGKIVLPLDRLVQFPQLTMKLDADWIKWVGGVQESGQPSIISVSAPDFRQNGWVYFTVKNIGTGFGAFEASITCPSPFSQNTGSARFDVQAGSQASSTLGISATVETKTTKTCTLNVFDRNNPANQDSMTFTVTALPPGQICTPGQNRCNLNIIEKCNTYGSAWETFEVCQEGMTCVYVNGQPVCSQKGDDTCATQGQNCDLKACCTGLTCTGGFLGLFGKICQTEEPPNPWLWLWIPILALLFGAVGYKWGDLIGGIIGGIAGGIAGYAVYWFMSLPAWVQILLGIFGVAGTGIFIYIMLFGGGAIAVLALYAAVKK